MVERFVYDGEHVWADFDGSGDVTARYLYADAVDEVLARYQTGNGVAWYLTDHLGSVRDIADADGDVVDHLDYDSFGNVVAETSPAYGDRIKFTGREYDSEIGLYYYRARYYDPATSRFTAQDPIGFAAGDANLYRYVGNTPLTTTDPTGLTSVAFTAGALAYDLQMAEGVNGFTFGYACGYLDAFYSGDPNPNTSAMLAATAGYAIGVTLSAAPLKFALMTSVAVSLAGISSIRDAAMSGDGELAGIRTVCFMAPLARSGMRFLSTQTGQQAVRRLSRALVRFARDEGGYLDIDGIAGALKSWGVWLAIRAQKQAEHIPGTPQNANRVKQGGPISTFVDADSADALTQLGWWAGTPVPGRPNVRDFEFGTPVGIGPNGGTQSKVRVHMDTKGRIHGHPAGPEKL